jgi:hypothetical protein
MQPLAPPAPWPAPRERLGIPVFKPLCGVDDEHGA